MLKKSTFNTEKAFSCSSKVYPLKYSVMYLVVEFKKRRSNYTSLSVSSGGRLDHELFAPRLATAVAALDHVHDLAQPVAVDGAGGQRLRPLLRLQPALVVDGRAGRGGGGRGRVRGCVVTVVCQKKMIRIWMWSSRKLNGCDWIVSGKQS